MFGNIFSDSAHYVSRIGRRGNESSPELGLKLLIRENYLSATSNFVVSQTAALEKSPF